MEYRQTKHQVARGTRADAETFDTLFLFKNVSELRVTYQIRLLLYRAETEGKKLVIDVPNACNIHPKLETILGANRDHIRVERS